MEIWFAFPAGRGGCGLSQELVVCQALWLKSAVAVSSHRFHQASELLTRCLHTIHHLLSVIDKDHLLLPLVMKMRVGIYLVVNARQLLLTKEVNDHCGYVSFYWNFIPFSFWLWTTWVWSWRGATRGVEPYISYQKVQHKARLPGWAVLFHVTTLF